MFPYRDDNPTLSTPVVTVGLIIATTVVWVLVQGMGAEPAMSRSVCQLALIPAELLSHVTPGTRLPLSETAVCVLGEGHTWYTPITSMFLHGGWFHLLGNMWFLWLFGNNVEDSMGRARYLAFYLLCGLAAALTQAFVEPSSALPVLGASGAISGVMGAYVMLYPRVRIHTLIVLIVFFARVTLPAWVMLGYWFAIQLVSGAMTYGSGRGGVAFWAHGGGFVAGALLVTLFKNPARVAQHRAMARTM